MCVGSCELLMDENLQHQRTFAVFQFPVSSGGWWTKNTGYVHVSTSSTLCVIRFIQSFRVALSQNLNLLTATVISRHME